MEKVKISKEALIETINEFALIQNRGGYNHYSFDDRDLPTTLEIRILKI